MKDADGLGARYFNVISIPRYVLLGKDGLVIDDDVTNQEMEKLILANL